ncbi:hypothetical protein FBZ87_107138 [Nitrospirillum amazonense]|uniref:Uncharacterized protein n=1 Tax=Nitrospirillum amazonense TaxID=28077 RepID=A0A560JMR4_9PROT|nr:hypothetical protein [Nitrospirillum amazonense]TWB70754.1 hypothetical protein FBZ87_107138 [Nitrospirillum amazonense]
MNATMPAIMTPEATLGRRILVGPGVHARLPARKPAATRLGRIAQTLAERTTAATFSLAAASSYLFALTQASMPAILFGDAYPVPQSPFPQSGVPSPQASYDAFRDQFATFQAQAGTWITPRRGAELPSVFSQLASLPRLLADMTRVLDDALAGRSGQGAGRLPCAHPLKACERAVRRRSEAVSALLGMVTQQGQWLATTATALAAAAQAGVLGQLLAAHGGEAKAMTMAVHHAQACIAAETSRIIDAGLGGASSVAVGVVGLTMCWNPLGWSMIPGGVVGTHNGAIDLPFLQGQLGKLEALIEVKLDRWRQEQAAAMLLAGMRVQLMGVAPMVQAAQEELAALAWLLGRLPSEVSTALDDDDLSAARGEWGAAMADAGLSDALSLYLWPSPTHLSAPSTVAVAGDDVFRIAASGRMYHHSPSAPGWTDMQVTALSCVSDGYDLVAIDGAPVASVQSDAGAPSSYHVKLYDRFTQVWTTISAFPASCVAVGQGTIYAVNQAAGDGRVHRYNGMGKSWTALPMLPGPDVAAQIAVAGGVVFALTNNSQTLYRYNPARQNWGRVGRAAYLSIRANGNKLGMVDADNRAYLYDALAGGPPRQVGACVNAIAQLSTGEQLGIASGAGALWHIDTRVQPPCRTYVTSEATAVFASDTDVAYHCDGKGDLHRMTPDGGMVRLPSLPL